MSSLCCWSIGADGEGHPATAEAGGPARIALRPEVVRTQELALVFLATPPEVSMELAPALLDAGARVVDLSGAFRLRTPENYTAWYKEPHTQPDLLAEAVLRAARILPGAHSGGAAGVQSGLLSHGRQPGHPAAHGSRRGGPRGGHRLRRQIAASAAPGGRPA